MTTIPRYPLQWPPGWKRTPSHARKNGQFGSRKKRGDTAYATLQQITINEAVGRLLEELRRFGVREDDVVISTNLELRLDGLPRSGQGNPSDAGIAVYWLDRKHKDAPPKCIAVDQYFKVADNIAAAAATLEAMRAIDRHGGAAVLERAFVGFAALQAPEGPHWSVVLGVPADAGRQAVEAAWRRLRSELHPDKPSGDHQRFIAAQAAYDRACVEVRHG